MADRMLGDFAVEVDAEMAAGMGQYSVDYVLSGDDRYRFAIAPAAQQHGISLGPQHRNFMSNDRNSVINRDAANHLRMEVRGDTMTIFVNGVELDHGQHEGLRRRDGTVELAMAKRAGTPGDLSVRFSNFKVYSLAS
jgi:hypothetical protein